MKKVTGIISLEGNIDGIWDDWDEYPLSQFKVLFMLLPAVVSNNQMHERELRYIMAILQSLPPVYLVEK